MTSRPGPDLQDLIGEAAFIRLAEAFGGTRLYVPTNIDRAPELVAAVGVDLARKLSARLAPDYVRVPLARELRARHYRAEGASNAQIARKLGVHESSVNKIFRRMPDVPAKGSAQLSFLDE